MSLGALLRGLDQETRDGLSLVSSYLTVAYDTLRRGPLGQEDAKAALAALEELAARGDAMREPYGTAREAAGAVRDAIAAAQDTGAPSGFWDTVYSWANPAAYAGADWFEAKRAALDTLARRIYARASTGDNYAGAALVDANVTKNEESWSGAVGQEQRRSEAACSILEVFTGEKTLGEYWGCAPLGVKVFVGVLGAGAALQAYAAWKAVRR